jgi:hypothetical protein
MDAIVAIVAIVAALLGLDLAAAHWGADTRPGMTDDHLR